MPSIGAVGILSHRFGRRRNPASLNLIVRRPIVTTNFPAYRVYRIPTGWSGHPGRKYIRRFFPPSPGRPPSIGYDWDADLSLASLSGTATLSGKRSSRSNRFLLGDSVSGCDGRGSRFWCAARLVGSVTSNKRFERSRGIIFGGPRRRVDD